MENEFCTFSWLGDDIHFTVMIVGDNKVRDRMFRGFGNCFDPFRQVSGALSYKAFEEMTMDDSEQMKSDLNKFSLQMIYS